MEFILDIVKEALAFASVLDTWFRSLSDTAIWDRTYSLARTLVFAYILVLPFELLWARDRKLKIFRPGFMTDIAHMFFTKTIGSFLTFVVVTSFVYVLIDQYLPLNGIRELIRSQPVWLQAVEIFILSDFLGYWAHRWMHESPLLWRAHACHHSSPHLDLLATVRVHPLQLLLQAVVGGIIPFMLGFSIESYGIVFAIVYKWGYFCHGNIKVPENSLTYRLLSPLSKVFITPLFHHRHHDYYVYNVNYGVMLTIWDKMYGTTYQADHNHFPEKYGIPGPYPQTWLGQILFAFLPGKFQAGLVDREEKFLPRSKRTAPSANQ